MTTHRPGALLCHPIFVGALVVLLVNDHYLKATSPSWMTGKLSDLAGLIVAPIAIVSAIEIIGGVLRLRRFEPRQTMPAVSAIVGCVFALVQTVPMVTNAYASAAGVTARIAFGAVGRTAGSGPAAVTADLTDLLTLPVLVVPLLLVLRPGPAWLPLELHGTGPALRP